MFDEQTIGAAAPTPSPTPSVKASVRGSVFLTSVQGVKGLMAAGRLSREEVEFELQRDDIRYLDDKIIATDWYPVGCFDRFASIAIDALSDGDLGYLASQGAAAAARALGSQAYQGFIDAARIGRESAGPGASVLTMGRLMLNFSRWELDSEQAGTGQFQIRVTEAGDLPETLRYAGQGFIQHLASLFGGQSIRVSSERLDQDTILYRGCAAQ